jgi:cytochrome c
MIDKLRVAAAFSITLALVGAARADGDAARGEKKFGDCAACHKLEAGANNVGPSLHGIFGRQAGEIADFRYSPAMKRSGIVWAPETLDRFISEPQAMVPGNRMPYAGMASAGDRADLLAFLAKASQ